MKIWPQEYLYIYLKPLLPNFIGWFLEVQDFLRQTGDMPCRTSISPIADYYIFSFNCQKLNNNLKMNFKKGNTNFQSAFQGHTNQGNDGIKRRETIPIPAQQSAQTIPAPRRNTMIGKGTSQSVSNIMPNVPQPQQQQQQQSATNLSLEGKEDPMTFAEQNKSK